MLAIRMANYPIHLLSYPQPIVITFTLYKYHQKNSDFPGNQLLKFYPKFSILMYYSSLFTHMFSNNHTLYYHQNRKYYTLLALWN